MVGLASRLFGNETSIGFENLKLRKNSAMSMPKKVPGKGS